MNTVGIATKAITRASVDTLTDPSRTIMVWCPDWSVHAALMQHPQDEAARPDEAPAIALIDKGLVFACSFVARREGIQRGLRVREAQARFPGLIVLPYDAVGDARLFESLCEAARAISPGVQLIRPGLIALRARGPARFYGSEQAAAAKLLDAFQAQGISDARVGIADGPFAAELAAKLNRSKYSPENPGRVSESGSVPGLEIARMEIIEPGGSSVFLSGMPVETIGDAFFTDLCHRLGLHTLGQLATLDKTALTERFGALGTRVHALVTGRDRQSVVPSDVTPRLERAITFDEPLELAEQVAFAVRQSAEELVMAASSQRLIITAVTVTIETERNVFDRSWLHPRNFTAAEIVDRVRWQLQGTVVGAVTRVTLSAENVDAAHRHEEGLWGGSTDERVHHALSRVQSMLGHEAVLTARIGGGRMPGQRRLLIPWGDRPPSVAQSRADQPWPGRLPDPQPSAVFTPRLPVTVVDGRGETVTVTERGALSAAPESFISRGDRAVVGRVASKPDSLRAWAGPWPLDEHWWDATAACSLHRFAIVDSQGTAWLLVTNGAGRWEAEGRYD